MDKKKHTSRVLCENRKARHDYEIRETVEAGLVLEGWEVKAIRAGRSGIRDAHARILSGEAFLIGMDISPLPQSASAVPAPDARRTRKLLLSRKEIDRLFGSVEKGGMTLVPLALVLSRGRVKASLGLAKGRDKADIRRAEREREADTEARAAMSVRVRGSD